MLHTISKCEKQIFRRNTKDNMSDNIFSVISKTSTRMRTLVHIPTDDDSMTESTRALLIPKVFRNISLQTSYVIPLFFKRNALVFFRREVFDGNMVVHAFSLLSTSDLIKVFCILASPQPQNSVNIVSQSSSENRLHFFPRLQHEGFKHLGPRFFPGPSSI